MIASVSDPAPASPRHRPHPRTAYQRKHGVQGTTTQLSSTSHHKQQNPRNARMKPTGSKFPASDVNYAAIEGDIGDYRDALWYKAGEGDLLFAQWFLGRCNGVGDARTPHFADAIKRIFALFKIQRKLRHELAMSSKKEVDEENEETGDKEHEDDSSDEPLWPVEEIVEQVGGVLRVSRLELLRQQTAAQKNNTNLEGDLERIVVAEVVENATELILSRATSDHESLLRRWVEILKEEEKVEEFEAMGASLLEVRVEVVGNVDEATAHKIKKREKNLRLRKKKSRDAEESACKQIESFLTFLTESAQTEAMAEASVTATPSEAREIWSQELQHLVELSSIDPDEEERRLRVARDIQTVLKREVTKWRHCEVILYGSSLTCYGSRTSDLDMCLLPNGRTTGMDADSPKEVVGRRQLRRLIDGKSGKDWLKPSTDSGVAEQLRDQRAQVQSSIEKIVQALNVLDRSDKMSDKLTKQRRHLEYFYTQMRLLRNAIVAELTGLLGVEESLNIANLNGKSAQLKATIAASRCRSGDLYLLRVILQRAAKCEVRQVIAGARVPIIRFLYTRSDCAYECDLCFENVLATRNTPLLRAYASFDNRARALGLAVKHWAKQRGISDASIGFLSSYTFVLLSIFYLQVVQVLPNLQNPALLKFAHVQPVYYNDINIAFCEDRGLAQAYHQRTSASDSTDMSLTTLLAGFFEFYATQFDYAKRVVAVQSPETPVQKLELWGSRRAKTWRMSIQDPLETERDLGCVLQVKGQERIIHEFRRAHKMLIQGKSFSDMICAVEKPAGKLDKTKQMNGNITPGKKVQSIPSQLRAGKMTRSYMLLLRSADEELTKETIGLFFKWFRNSFQVGKVVEATTLESVTGGAGNKNKLWEVELLTQARNCPRVLSLKTRIDWKASDGRAGRVWLHHQSLFATPPCEKCLSPEHTMSECPPEDINEGDNDKDAGAGDRGELRLKYKAQRNIGQHVLRVTLNGDSSTAISKRNGRRMKQQQYHESSQPAHVMSKLKPTTRRSTNATGKKEPRNSDKKREIKRFDGRHEDVVASPLASRGEGDGDIAGKTTQKRKKWQQRAHRKNEHLKGNKTNAAL